MNAHRQLTEERNEWRAEVEENRRRIRELDAEVGAQQARAERAETKLARVELALSSLPSSRHVDPFFAGQFAAAQKIHRDLLDGVR